MTLFPGVALVTGAASGIGRATAYGFAREGCTHIVIADVSLAGLEETFTNIKSAFPSANVLFKQTDISQPDQVSALLDLTIESFGRVDYACNCAGILDAPKRSHDMDLQDFDRMVSINYRGSWLCSREELKHMIKQEHLPSHDGRPGFRGSIVNVASQLGIVARPNAPAYCSAKAAIINLTKSDAIDYSKDSIRVNCVCPGVIETPMIQPNMGYLSSAIAIAPMNRCGTADEVADCILFLSSSKASFVQGAAMVVDGGYTIN
ncbi:hypothetical protein AAFC00_003348 [Neodothiora populina]|uniref:NAD(P)-binding protein n=1 Tax=Neodothiora populina TaxID=2781224 RepID=A0ABR3PBE6_9PEZI